MGREIRRVPPDWVHPMQTNRMGREYPKPLHDASYAEVADKWIAEFEEWRSGELNIGECIYYWEYDEPPDPEYYRDETWTEDEATAFQIYENVSEGTPVSPVFATVEEMRAWLLEQGHSEYAINEFIRHGYAFSAVIGPLGFASGIDAYDVIRKESE